ncbi:murein transglycosylase [Chromobacterium sp. LK1]|uniref:peptidoglycan lytic exotransglycosylase n=1 Tax=Chromobacterium aquaticum TaxID=467180 RepID=A0ABV8ZM55_9NEIS|nr:murein transglycosylase [Chromobacterium sp. LK1]
MLRKWLLLLLVIGLAACSTSSPPGKPGGGPRDTGTPNALPAWGQQELGDTLAALKQSCKAIAKKPGWADVCRQADGISNENAPAVRQFFENRFAAWKVNDGSRDSGLITGYYEPLLSGSRMRSARTPWPVYGIPADFYSVDVPQAARGKSSLMARRSGPNRLTLSPTGDIEVRPADFPADARGTRLKGRLDGKRLLPYYTRAEINQGKGVANAPILAWVEDPVELFFLQVQGSGRIQLDDGSFVHIGYAEQNGYGYQSIGKWLVDKGELTMSNASMQGIKDWLARNPQRQQELFAVNPSYVFFKTLPGDNGGPVGALGVPLTGGYSIAVDPRYIPLGAPVYLVTTWPHSSQPLARLVHAQDTGSAIKGAVRADFFWGYGTEAGMYAGRMKQQGNLWMLLPKGMNPSQAL